MDNLDQTSVSRVHTASSTNDPWRVVPLLMLVVAIGHFNRVGMSVVGTEQIMPQYKIAPERMGLVYSAFLLFYTLAMLPGGWFIDRFGPRAALSVFAFGSAAFVALTGCVGLIFREAHTVWLALLVVRSLMGIVNAPLHPASARMVYEHAPRNATSFANGLVTFAACLGIAGTYYGLGALMDVFGWSKALLTVGCITVALATVWHLGTSHRAGMRNVHHDTSRTMPTLKEMFRLLKSRSLLCITLSYTALGYFQYLFFYWIEYYFETIQKQGVDVARQYTTLITLAMGVGMVCGGWLADRVPRSWSTWARNSFVPVVGMIASGLVFELGLLSENQRVILAAFALSAALIGACEASFWTTVVALGGAYGGTAAGLMNTGGNAGGTLSPYLTPLMSGFFAQQFGDSRGWRLGLAVAAAVPILGALLWYGVRPTGELDDTIDQQQ